MPTSTTSGGIVTVGTPGPKPRRSPPSTSRIGYGIRSGPARMSNAAADDHQREQLQLLPRAELQDHRRLGHPDRCVHPSKLQAGTHRSRRAGARIDAIASGTVLSG